MRTLGAAGAVVALLAVVGCGDDTEADGISVYTSVYPLEWLTAELAGDQATVTNLTEPGTDPHDLELSPRQVGEMGEADLVVYISGMQPAVDEAVAEQAPEHSLDIADVVELRTVPDDEGGGLDPHMWLDPERFITAGEALSDRLSEIDPDGEYGAEAVTNELSDLDAEYQAGLADCAQRAFVVSHAAFGYLADRYDLEQIAISGIESDSEPSPARIREIASIVDDRDIDTIYTETLASARTADIIAEETGVETSVLDPLEGITEASPGDDYPSVMSANLSELTAHQRCST
ncbi:metal ABC transporter substrate-binding protein [Spiractinospora alimapuensis]|uniref:metal ABC transporter substrate-binding protein n=1 Tax=Spiractinospora alimapuensis TaxID=2820884 RepID=UPI001F3E8612|nr:metal ABC transporter substrate-binding protein [Spiractinospora alimapuensis]